LLRLLGSQQRPQIGDLITSLSTGGTENSLTEINLECPRGVIKGCNIFWGSKIDRHLQLRGRTHYRATRKNLESRTQLDEPSEWASGGDLLLLYKILHLLFFLSGTNSLCNTRCESKKIINMILIGTFRISISSGK